MPRGPHEKKFEADIPRTLFDAYEEWASGRGRISNRQLMVAMFRLFLAAPDALKMAALYGTDDQIDFGILRASQTPDEVRADLERIRRVAADLDDEAVRLLNADEQAVVDRLRTVLSGHAEDAKPNLAKSVVSRAVARRARRSGTTGGKTG